MLSECHDYITTSFIEGFWTEALELSLKHRLPLQAFLDESNPKARFVSRHTQWERRHPQEDVIPRAVDDLVRRTSHALDVYVRRYVDRDFTAPYFDAACNFDEACHIAWIAAEMTVLDYQELTGRSFAFCAGDRVYAFCSSAYSWQNGFGRHGLMVLRACRIVECVVLEAS